MYYRLTEKCALRAWKYVNHVVLRRDAADPIRMDEETFQLLLDCDGEHDLAESEVLRNLTEQGLVCPCDRGEAPSAWSRFRRYEHRYVPWMNFMITGKCNYNCRHCFNAADNADRMEEWDYDAVIDLLDQAADCGIHAITLTGGEPMLHPRFADIVRAIAERNMVLDKLTTNGFYLRQETLDMFRELGFSPQIKISFDGVGHHDWMRGHPGAEEDAKRAFRLGAENGFRMFSQTQVHRGNLDAIPETLRVLEDLGVSWTRIIRTTAVPRWIKNGADLSLSFEEYFERMLDLADRYVHGDHRMTLAIWQFLVLFPKDHAYHMTLDLRADGQYRPAAPVCLSSRIMMAVTCEGNVVPCMQMSGYAAQLGQRFDSLKERRLSEILKEGKWLSDVCMNHYHLREANPNCDACEWFGHCGGGCRALGALDAVERTGKFDYTTSDPLACLFYKGGWYDRVKERFSDLTVLP